MSNITLYELTAEYRETAERLSDLDLDVQTIADTLESMSGELETKCTNIAFVIRNFEVAAAQIKEAESAMAARRKAIESRAAHIKQYLFDGMIHAGIHKIESPYFKLAIQDNPPSVVVDEPGLIPAEYMRQPEPPPPAPDKVALARDLKAGVEIAGAHLERGRRLVIK
jgi:hypothetical protein